MEMKYILIALLTMMTCLAASMAAASSWPVFVPPDKELLSSLGYLDSNSCPSGQARISANGKINIRSNLCKTFCPATWNWQLFADNACHELATEFEFQKYEISRQPGDNEETLYSIVTAYYGKSTAAEPSFKIEFQSERDDHWYCMETRYEKHGIICANDVAFIH